MRGSLILSLAALMAAVSVSAAMGQPGPAPALPLTGPPASPPATLATASGPAPSLAVAPAPVEAPTRYPFATPAKRIHRPLLVAFSVPWDVNAVADLQRHLGSLDVYAPQIIALSSGAVVSVTEEPAVAAILAARRGRPAVMPLVVNAHDHVWDPEAAAQALLDPALRASLLTRLADLARERGYGGYIFDFEGLTPQAAAAYPAFMSAARAALGGHGREVWATATLGPDALPTARLADAADALVLMGYDECWITSNPGPVAGPDWLAALLAQRVHGVDPSRLIVALGAYAYDWPDRQPARVLSLEEAGKLAAVYQTTPEVDPASRNRRFSYVDPAGVHHSVWMAAGEAFASNRVAALALHPRGLAMWRLGLDDEGVWAASLAKPGRAAPVALRAPHPCDPL